MCYPHNFRTTYLTTWNFYLFLLDTTILKLKLLFFINHPVLLHHTLFDILENMNVAQFCNFIFLGDFNINVNDPVTFPNFFNLTQVVNGCTHVSPCGNPALIDLAFMSSITKPTFGLLCYPSHC